MEHPITKRRRVLLRITVLAVGLGAIPTSPAQSPTTDPTVVQVEGGKVRGAAEKDLLVFKSIPFAQPPIGGLRWRPPQPGEAVGGRARDDGVHPGSDPANEHRIDQDDLFRGLPLPERVAAGGGRGQAVASPWSGFTAVA
jgi:Carboxylesterase family